MPAERATRLCFVGPHLGRHPGWVTSQGEILAALFAGEGYSVRSTSSALNPVARLLDVLTSLWRWRRDVDAVVISVFSGRGFWIADAASRWARRLGAAQIQVLHGGGLPELARRRPHRLDRLFRRAHALVAPSRFLAATAASLGHRAAVIPNVLDIEQYPDRRVRRVTPRLLWMRTFHDIYHPVMALEVLGELRRGGIDARLTMAGQDKGLLPSVRRRSNDLGLEGRVRFPGFLDMEGKRRELANHDVFLNTNRIDNMPVTVLEAAACGVPVVATRVGGVPYLLEHERTALLVDDGDAPAMAAAVRRLLGEPDLAERLSRHGRQLAESCAWGAVLPAWEKLLAGLGRLHAS